MMLKRAIYTVSCDECGVTHPTATDIRALMKLIKSDGWEVDGDVVTCPDCIKKRGE